MAPGLVVAPLTDGAHGAALDTDGAVLPGEEVTVGVMVAVGARRGRQGQAGDDRAAAHGLAQRRDEAVAEPEGAQPGGVSDVALGPGARHPFCRPLRQARGGDGRDSGCGEHGHEVFTQGDVEPLTGELGPHPALRRQAPLSAVVALGLLRVRQDPADHRQVARVRRPLREGQRERFAGRPVRRADVLLELGEQGVVAGGEADERRGERRLLLRHAEAVVRRAAEPGDHLDDPVGPPGAVRRRFPAHPLSLDCVNVGVVVGSVTRSRVCAKCGQVRSGLHAGGGHSPGSLTGIVTSGCRSAPRQPLGPMPSKRFARMSPKLPI